MGTIILENNINTPVNIDHAIEILKRNTKEEDIKYIKSLSEKDFVALSHFSFGMNLRNNWHLWWSKRLARDHKDKGYPQEMPAIVDFFHKINIYHADDMSSIIIKSFYRHLTGEDIKLKEQAQYYINFWAEQGIDAKEEYEKEE